MNKLNVQTPNKIKQRFESVLFTLLNRMGNNNNALFAENGEERLLNEMVSIFPEQPVVFDVGANIGEYTEIVLAKCKAAGKQPIIHLFEPSQKAFSTLVSKFSHQQNIILNNAGLSDTVGDAEIFFDEEGSTLASLYQRRGLPEHQAPSMKSVIKLTSLEEYIRTKGINRIDLVKLDIEGHEYAAMKGAGEYLKPSVIKMLQFEYGATTLDAHVSLLDFFQLLEGRGYVIGKIMKQKVERLSYDLRYDNFQYANFTAISPELMQ